LYYLFFNSEQWGIFKRAKSISKKQRGKIRIPNFTPKQIKKLSDLYKKIVKTERDELLQIIKKVWKNKKKLAGNTSQKNQFDLPSDITEKERKDIKSKLKAELRKKIDNNIFSIFEIPEDIRAAIKDFIKTKLPLDNSSIKIPERKPSNKELKDYALELREELDDYVMGKSYNKVAINKSKELIECVVQVNKSKKVTSVDIKECNLTIEKLFAEIKDNLKIPINQSVYIQKGLRLYAGPTVYIYKLPTLINWTKTQAKIDAGEIIGDAIPSNEFHKTK